MKSVKFVSDCAVEGVHHSAGDVANFDDDTAYLLFVSNRVAFDFVKEQKDKTENEADEKPVRKKKESE